MLDLKFVLGNLEAVEENCRRRRATCDLEAIRQCAAERSKINVRLDELRRRQKEVGKSGGKDLSDDEKKALKRQGKELRAEAAQLGESLGEVEERLFAALRDLPNLSHPDAPVGESEEDNRVLRQVGEPPRFDFSALDHIEIGKALDILDFDAGTRVSGKDFFFLRNEGVYLELALCRYALDVIRAEGFTPSITPDLAKDEILDGIGFSPRGPETQVYSVEGSGLSLIGTAEITLGGMLQGEIVRDLPVKVGGLSHCFRTEAGAYGKASKGLYRVHQFTKVEMFIYCRPGESDAMLEHLLAVEERIFTSLGIPYRVVDTCTGELGAPAFRKYDLEAWMPGRGKEGEWGEITSCSNCTDYQARRLKIRYKPEGGKGTRFVHTLNGTAVAVSRALLALLENHQQKDGSVVIPEVLRPYTGFDLVRPRKARA
jgi:seryl-tRNA synthetase